MKNNQFITLNPLWCLVLLIFFSTPEILQADQLSKSFLEKTDFSAKGINNVILNVHTYGRYAIQANSKQGTFIRLIDQMAGVIAERGIVGKEDGRIDIILDAGTYKVRTFSPSDGVGRLKLSLNSFHNENKKLDISKIPVLGKFKIEERSLKDYQQHSFWIETKNREPFIFEALGRNLSSCRLWHEGNWLTDILPKISTYEPQSGRPMTHVEFYQTIEPGLYLMQCYGGQALKWANDDKTNPFYARMGIPTLGDQGFKFIELSPFGRDFFVLSDKPDFFQLTRDEKELTLLSVKRWDFESSRFRSDRYESEASITKKSRIPWCQTEGSKGRRQLVSITAKPGDTIKFTYFKRYDYSDFNSQMNTWSAKQNKHWISSIESEGGIESIDLTGYIFNKKTKEIIQAHTLEIGKGKALSRQINLQGDLSVVLKVNNNGTYTVEEDTTFNGKAHYKFYRLFADNRRNLKEFTISNPSDEVKLLSGYYRLKIYSKSKGILKFTLQEKSLTGQIKSLMKNNLLFKAGIFNSKKKSKTKDNKADDNYVKKSQGIIWPNAPKWNSKLQFGFSIRPGIAFGMVTRRLPVNLDQGLPLILLPNQSVEIPLSVKKSRRIHIDHRKDSSFQMLVNGSIIPNHANLKQGKYKITFKNSGKTKSVFTLQTVPIPIAILTPSQIKKTVDNSIKGYRIISENQPLFEKFDRNEKKTFMLSVQLPGLYRIETSGRLRTALKIRTKTIVSLFSGESNGIGRNALVQQYLKPGEYKVTASTEGSSKGWAGIHLNRNSIKKAGFVKPGDIKRTTLAANEALQYQLRIDKDDEYLIKSLGLNKKFNSRLEDEQGWPLFTSLRSREFEIFLSQGIYHLYSLPEPLESRRVISITKMAEEKPLKGKGPHQISLNQKISHTWRHTEDSQPDRYQIFIPAQLKARIYLSEGFEGQLQLENDTEVTQFKLKENQYLEDDFGPGEYTLRISRTEKDDYVPYQLTIWTDDLANGIEKKINTLPKTIKVKVADDSMVEIYSQGSVDVKARLERDFDMNSGPLMAKNDDRENDWNFQIFKRLKKGEYVLKLDSGPSGTKKFIIGMRELKNQTVSQMNIPFKLTQTFSHNRLLVIPIIVPQPGLFRFKISGENSIGLALLKGEKTIAESREELILPLRQNQKYSLLAWSLDKGQTTADLSASILVGDLLSLKRHEDRMIEFTEKKTSVFQVKGAGLSTYTLEGSRDLLLCPAESEIACSSIPDSPVTFKSGKGWLIGVQPQTTEKLKIQSLTLNRDAPIRASLGNQPLYFSFKNKASTPNLISVISLGERVGLTLNKNTNTEFVPSWQSMVINPSNTLTFSAESGVIYGRVWLTKATDNINQVRLTTQTFQSLPEKPLNQKVIETAIPAKKSQIISLANDINAVEVTLTKGLTLGYSRQGQTVAMVSADTDNTSEILPVNGGKLILFNPSNAEGFFRYKPFRKIADHISNSADIEASKLFEKVFHDQGKFEIHVKQIPANQSLFIDGSYQNALFFMDDGRIQRFDSDGTLDLSQTTRNGIVRFNYTPGYIQVWYGFANKKDDYLIDSAALPQVIDLPGNQVSLFDTTQQWQFTTDRLSYLSIATKASGATFVLSGDNVIRSGIGVDSDSRDIHTLLSPGSYRIITRPLNGIAQSGILKIQQVFPQQLEEGTSLNILKFINPGENHLYEIDIKAEDTNVGLGVRAQHETVNVQVFDPGYSYFHPRYKGPLVFARLPAQKFYMLVNVEKHYHYPLTYTPVVFGTTGSNRGIPQNIIKQYK